MPVYFYKAKSFSGKLKKGEIFAKDELELARILYQKGYILISAVPEEKREKIFFGFKNFFKKISLKEKLIFTRNLQVMIKSGISLPRALESLALQTKNKKFQKILLALSNDLRKGESFSKALAKYPAVFGQLYFQLVKVGEESGTLEQILTNLVLQMEKTQDLRSKVKSALIYPAVIVLVMILIAILMLLLVVPKLSQVFEELKIELPMTTQIVMNLGNFLAQNIFFLFFGFLGFFLLIWFFLKTKEGKKAKDFLFLKLPLLAPLIKKVNASYAIRNLSILTKSGVSLLKSLEIVAEVLPNFYFKEAILKAKETVKKGGKLSEGLKEFTFLFPPTTLEMIKVGEETGETSKILAELSDFFEKEVAIATKNLVSLIEPILMVLIGAVVGFFAISMIQPIYSMLGTF